LTDFNDIFGGNIPRLYLQQNLMQHVRLMFTEHRYLKF